MFAAIAHDGTRYVVLGVGPTEVDARTDASSVLESMAKLSPDDVIAISRVVAVTDAQADMFRRGLVACQLLGIPELV